MENRIGKVKFGRFRPIIVVLSILFVFVGLSSSTNASDLRAGPDETTRTVETPSDDLSSTSQLADVNNFSPSNQINHNKVPLAPTATCDTGLNDIGGTLWRDYNADGVNDALEPGFGVAGMVVSAYEDGNATPVATTSVDSDGTYVFSGLADGRSFRLEFSGLPSYLEFGAVGTNSESHVQFVRAATCSADLSVMVPTDYCESLNPRVATSCFVYGESNGVLSGDPALVTIPYTATGHDYVGNDKTANFQGSREATIGDVGGTYGIAWQRTTRLIYAGAFQKRYSGYGSGGPDAIYMVDPAANTVEGIIELDTLLGASDTAGADTHNFTPDGDDVIDLAAADQVGRMSWGDLDISVDMSTLYATNLHDRKIYAFDVSAGTAASVTVLQSWDTPDQCAGSEHRPFALAVHNGRLWVGSVCEDSLNAYVHSFVPDTATTAPTMSLEITIPLNFDRENPIGTNLNDAARNSNWLAWEPFATITINTTSFSELWAPQPMLSDIEFDGENMILGFRDRFGDQSGSGQKIRSDFAGLGWGTTAGDILRVCNVNGAFVLEGGAGCPVNGINDGSQTTGQAAGPGGAEYYYWDFIGNISAVPSPTAWDPDPSTAQGFHWETAQGGLVQLPGVNTIMSTAMDPMDDFSGGVYRFVNDTGRREGINSTADCIDTNGGGGCDDQVLGGYTIYEGGDFSGTPPLTDLFSKANGLGDLEVLCAAAPVEVGNRVWNDADGNGVQDPSEAGLDGVTVTLTCGADKASVQTANGGLYNFSNALGGNATFMDSGESCTITVVDTFNGLAITSGTDATNDNHDSDADATGSISFVVGGAGQNNHSFDIGYSATYAIGNYVWLDENSDGYQDAGERGLANVIVNLIDSNGTIYTTTTDANGGYVFNNLPVAGTYTVTIDTGQSALTGLSYTVPNSTGADMGNQDPTGYVVTVGNGQPAENLTADFGFNYGNANGNSGNGSIGDAIWADVDGDGMQDPDEIGIANVCVELLTAGADGLFGTADDVVAQTTTTNANGQYIFDVAAGAYIVRVCASNFAPSGALGGWTQTGDPDHFGTNIGGNDNQTTTPIIVAPGDVFLNADFGYQPTSVAVGSIGDTIFYDADADGNGMSQAPVDGGAAVTQGAGESADVADYGIAGVTVALIQDSNSNGVWDSGEPIIASDTTDLNGQYLFTGLPLDDGDGAADYLVWVNDNDNVLAGLNATYDSDGLAPNTGMATGLGISAVAISTATPDDRSQDFGYSASLPLGNVGGTLWFDVDNSGGDQSTQGAETGIAGVTVLLYSDADNDGTPDDANGDGIIDENDALASTTTDSNGDYLFDNLPMGGYIVGVDVAQLPAGYDPTATYEPDGDSDNYGTAVTLTEATPSNHDQDFSYTLSDTGLNSIGDLVWFDINGDGSPTGEPGLGNVTVDLKACNNVRDNFGTVAYNNQNGILGNWTSDWSEVNDTGGAAGGVMLIDNTSGSFALHYIGTTNTTDESAQVQLFRQLDLTGETEATLTVGWTSVNAAGSNSETSDHFFVDVSTDGATWTNVLDLEGATDFGGTVGATDTGVEEIDISSVAGGTAFVRLRFKDMNSGNEDFYVNDIDVTSCITVATTTTDSEGNYLFTGLADGLYQVSVDESTLPSYVNTVATGDPEADGNGVSYVNLDANGANGTGVHDRVRDFGYDPTGATFTLGDTVWFDIDGSGGDQSTQGDEPGLSGVTVNLYDSGSNLVASTLTDENGHYLFTDLAAGTYTVAVDTSSLPSYVSTNSSYAGSDGSPTNSNSVVVVDGGNPHGRAEDFSYPPTTALGGIGDTIWFDLDNSGSTQDAGEPGIEGVIVTLTDSNGNVMTTETNENGNYYFGGLDPAGTYTVTVSPQNFNAGGVLEGMSQTSGGAAGQSVVTLSGDGIDLDQDWGYTADTPGQIGNLVWLDDNADGTFAGESPIAGVTLDLYRDLNCDGDLDAGEGLFGSTTTVGAIDGGLYGADGTYLFDNLPTSAAGVCYLVAVTDDAGVLSGYWHSSGTAATNNESQADPYGGITLTTGVTENLTADFGYYVEPACVGNFVWIDNNGNGIQDSNDVGLDGAEVSLTISYLDGTIITVNTLTGDDPATGAVEQGWYSFCNLLIDEDYSNGSGSTTATATQPAYVISVTLPDGYAPTVANAAAANDQNDSDPHSGVAATPTQGATTTTQNSDPSAESNPIASYDFGVVGVGAIGNYVWVDENSDGFQDAGERGIANVTVNLTDSSGNIYTTTTDANGGYLFDGLFAGTYTVTIPAVNPALTGMNYTVPNLAGADWGNQDPTGYEVTIGGAEPNENLSADFGYNYGNANGNDGTGAIGDTIWLDADGDGVQDPNEIGIANVCVELLTAGADGIFGSADDVIADTVTTDANGQYIFDGLAAGAYSVRVCASNFAAAGALEGWTQTGDPDHFGSNVGVNDNATTNPIILAPGDVILNADFGYQPPANEYDNSIGDTIWLDENGDGIEDAGEDGIPNVTVVLYDDNGNAIATTTTDDNGNYSFDNLPDGTYTVCVNDTDNVLGELTQTGDPDLVLDGCSTVSVSGGTPDNDQDFGYSPLGHALNTGLIGDTIWFDLDNSGGATQDAGEPGVEGVIVTLTDSSGNVITTTTNENGNYYFGGLDLDGTYTVTIAPDNFVVGGVLEGMSETYDPATGGAGQAVVDLSLDGDGIDLDQDWSYGVTANAGQVGNLVWLDDNANGTFAGESPIAGVTLDLYRDLNCDGDLDAGEGLFGSTTTAAAIDGGLYGADGTYLFDNLPTSAAGVCYLVDVTDDAGVLGGYWHSSGTSATNNESQADPYGGITLTTGATENLTADFGYYVEPACVGNFVWNDLDQDGIQDSGEVGIDNIPVTLAIIYPNGTTISLTVLTGDDPATSGVTEQGWYSFCNLLQDEDYSVGSGGTTANPGQPAYVISVALPEGYIPTAVDAAGSNDQNDSDAHDGVAATPVQGRTDTTALDPVTTEPVIASYDFGIIAVVEIGNRIWFEADGDGDGTNGSPTPASGLTVTAVDGNDNSFTAVTDANGLYTITVPASATYTVTVPTPSGYDPSTILVAGTDNNPATDDDMNHDSDGAVVVVGTVDNLTIDFAFTPATLTYGIGNLVWIDNEDPGDGTYTPLFDTPASDVTVNLYRVTGGVAEPTPFMTVTTSLLGAYQFTGLSAGTYQVGIPASEFRTGGDLLDGTGTALGVVGANSQGVDASDDGADHNTIYPVSNNTVIDGVRSNFVTLGDGAEPVNEPGHGVLVPTDPDDQTDWTVDFAFAQRDATLVTLTGMDATAQPFLWATFTLLALLTAAILLPRWRSD